jgi:hypothetical protein
MLTALVLLISAARPAAQTPLQVSAYQAVVLTAPDPLTDSVGYGLRNGQAVGTGRIPGSTYPDETHAVLWPPNTTVGVDLHPTDFRYSAAFDTNGTKQVGSGNGPPTNFARHALLWSGSANSYVDLHPSGVWNDSVARAIEGDQQVGNINFFYQGNESSPQSIVHAALWRGTAASVVDLHPSFNGCERSYGNDTDGSHQVGYCFFSIPNDPLTYGAVVWSGTAGSAVLLHPSGFTHSFAEGVSGNEQVGWGFNALEGDGYSRALLWHGTAASVVSLHPTGYLATTAYATNGINQVGSGSKLEDPSVSHALIWADTASSVLDLHPFLPSEFNSSIAFEITPVGHVIGLAQRPDGSTNAVIWWKNSSTVPPTATRTQAITSTPVRTATPIRTVTPTRTAAPTGNMLLNSGFEQDANNDGRPDVWTTSSKFTRVSELFYSGSYSGKFYATDNSNVVIRQVMNNVTAGAAYTFSGQVRIPPKDDQFTFKLQVNWRNASNSVISTSVIKTYTTSTDGWNLATVKLSAPPGTTNAVLIMTATSLNRSIYVDAFVFKR